MIANNENQSCSKFNLSWQVFKSVALLCTSIFLPIFDVIPLIIGLYLD